MNYLKKTNISGPRSAFQRLLLAPEAPVLDPVLGPALLPGHQQAALAALAPRLLPGCPGCCSNHFGLVPLTF